MGSCSTRSGRACTEFDFVSFLFLPASTSITLSRLISGDRTFSRAQRICRTVRRWYWTVSIDIMLAFINVLPIMVFGIRFRWTSLLPFCVSVFGVKLFIYDYCCRRCRRRWHIWGRARYICHSILFPVQYLWDSLSFWLFSPMQHHRK